LTEIILIFVVAICIWGLWSELKDAGSWDSKDLNRDLRKQQKKRSLNEKNQKNYIEQSRGAEKF